jgi:branched-chain amino acid transport system ATP-binding protein
MLKVTNLHAYYGPSHVLDGVDLDASAGEIVALLGRNGVGRSTTCKALMGLIEARGSVRFKGEELLGLQPHQVARMGLGYVPEERSIFADLTVYENLVLGVHGAPTQKRWDLADIYELFPQLMERRDVQAGMLSGGEQQMLTMSRTLMGNPDMLLIDEPTEGLAPKIVEQLARLIQEIAARGSGVLLIEQKLTIALKIASRVYVMGHGRIVFVGTPGELQEAGDVRKEWLEV